MGSQSFRFLGASSVLFLVFVSFSVAETPPTNLPSGKIGISNDNKLKRQNEGAGGEEVDLVGINQNQGGTSGFPQQPGQSPFFGGGNPFLQQPFFGNGLGGFSGAQQSSLFPSSGFSQGAFPAQGFPQNFPQFGLNGGRNVILQNNGKQYLVQELSDNLRVVQKNGKQYLLQPLTNAGPATNGALSGAPNFNIPSGALGGLPSPYTAQAGALNSFAPDFSSLAAGFPATGPGGSGAASQRLILNGNGQKFQVDQIPVRGNPSQNYLSQAVGAVSAQLAAQATGQQYANQYAPFGPGSGGLADAYSRANEAGYGLYSTGRLNDFSAGQPPAKRSAKGTSNPQNSTTKI